MEESGFYKAVGFVLALLFAMVMGLCVFAVLYADFAGSGGTVNERETTTLMITATTGAVAALSAWWLQKFIAARSFSTRFVYGVFIFLLMFCALGGLIEFTYGVVTGPGSVDLSPSELYFASLGAFYTFVIASLGSSMFAFAGLGLAAGLILAAVGPRRIY